MLTPKFWELAEKTKHDWREAAQWNPNNDINWNKERLFLTSSSSHCGTTEITNLQTSDSLQGATLSNLARYLCYEAIRCNYGHFLYYQPWNKKYEAAVKKFQKLGALWVYDFQHLGYLNREPDKGWCSLWMLEITPDDVVRLKELYETQSQVHGTRTLPQVQVE